MTVEFIRGPQASGKTTRCIDLAQATLDNGGSVLYVDGQICLDPSRLHTWLVEFEGRVLHTQKRDPKFVLQFLETFAPQFDLAILDGVSLCMDELTRVSRIARESDTAVWITKGTTP